MLNARASTEGRCRVSVGWPAQNCTSRFPQYVGRAHLGSPGARIVKSLEEPLLPQYAVFVTEYNVSISGGLYSASQNTKQNNQASTP